MAKSFRDLDVYTKSYNTALDIHKVTLTFPAIEQCALGSQMRRASKSICANIAEGFAKHHGSAPEFKRFLQISLGSSDEMAVWLDFARDLNYILLQDHERFCGAYTEISKMLYTLHKNWKC